MKKVLLLLTIPFLLAGCSNKQEENKPIDPIPVTPSGPTVKTDEVYLGYLCEKAYDPNSKVTFTVQVEDETIVKYQNKTLISNTKKGTTLIHFTSADLIYNVTVSVEDDMTVPHFELAENTPTINIDKTLNIKTTLTYRGVDAFSLSDGLHITKESDNDVAELKILETSKNYLQVKGLKTGQESFTIYTTLFGHTLSKLLTVTVKEDNSLIVVGKKLEFDDVGAIYNVSLYKYNENKLSLANDLTVSKNGQVIPFSDLTVTALQKSIVDFDGTYLVPVSTGVGSIKIEYQTYSLLIRVNVYKPLIDKINVTLDNADFNLNIGVELNDGAAKRIYSSTNQIKTIDMTGCGYDFVKVSALSVDGATRQLTSATDLTVTANVVSVSSNPFTINDSGSHAVTLIAETSEASISIETKMFFITKVITTVAEYRSYIPMRYENEAVFGYYKLGNDIDFSDFYVNDRYVANAPNVNVGFRGTFDGAGYSLLNCKCGSYALSITTGNGAIFKDFTIEAYIDTSALGCVIGRFMYGTTLKNVTINLDPNSVTDVRPTSDQRGIGFIACQSSDNVCYDSVVIHAEGKYIESLCGKNVTKADAVDIINTTVYCQDLRAIDADGKYKPTAYKGLTVIKDN